MGLNKDLHPYGIIFKDNSLSSSSSSSGGGGGGPITSLAVDREGGKDITSTNIDAVKKVLGEYLGDYVASGLSVMGECTNCCPLSPLFHLHLHLHPNVLHLLTPYDTHTTHHRMPLPPRAGLLGGETEAVLVIHTPSGLLLSASYCGADESAACQSSDALNKEAKEHIGITQQCLKVHRQGKTDTFSTRLKDKSKPNITFTCVASNDVGQGKEWRSMKAAALKKYEDSRA